MNVGENTQLQMVALESMAGLSIGLKYFDDDSVVYVSPLIHEQFLNSALPSLDFVTLKYRRTDKHIEDVVKEIIYELQKCPDGTVKNVGFNEMHKTHHKNQVAIDIEHSDGQGLPLPNIDIDI